MNAAARSVLVALALALAGCSAKIVVTEVSNDLPSGTAVNGIPFRMAKRYVAEIYEKRAKGYESVGRQPISIPDPSRLYVLGFQSDALANPVFDVVLNPDNTLQQVSLSSASQAAPALTAVAGQLNAAATAEGARQTASKTATNAAATAAVAADKAKQAADLASLQYELLKANPGATAEDLLKAAQKERSAKIDANEAARLAGRGPYFPEVSL